MALWCSRLKGQIMVLSAGAAGKRSFDRRSRVNVFSVCLCEHALRNTVRRTAAASCLCAVVCLRVRGAAFLQNRKINKRLKSNTQSDVFFCMVVIDDSNTNAQTIPYEHFSAHFRFLLKYSSPQSHNYWVKLRVNIGKPTFKRPSSSTEIYVQILHA